MTITVSRFRAGQGYRRVLAAAGGSLLVLPLLAWAIMPELHIGSVKLGPVRVVGNSYQGGCGTGISQIPDGFSVHTDGTASGWVFRIDNTFYGVLIDRATK